MIWVLLRCNPPAGRMTIYPQHEVARAPACSQRWLRSCDRRRLAGCVFSQNVKHIWSKTFGEIASRWKSGQLLHFHEVIRCELRWESAVMSYEAGEGSGGKMNGGRIPGSGQESL